jgi:replicative DNA helicase
MSENNTIGGYLGSHFQLKLFWQLLTNVEFGNKILKFLSVDYFDDINFKKLFLTIKQYSDEYEMIPNLENKSIYHALKIYNSKNSIEEEVLTEIIKQIQYWNDSVLNQKIPYDGDIVQKETFVFIKQQEYRKISEDILRKVKTGEIKSKKNIFHIEEQFSKINNIGDDNDYGVLLTDNIKAAFDKKFRETIPTGVYGIDNVTGGGLGKGEVGLVLAPSGVGKSTFLTKIANSALEEGKNVLQIIFEDTPDEIKRKHFTIWSKIPLSELQDRKDEAYALVNDKVQKIKNKLVIKKFDEDETTLVDVKNWIDNYQKKFGYKFDIIVLDYLDCLESHKKAVDQNQAELAIIKMFISMASKYDIPMWTAVQGNRCLDLNTIVDVEDKGKIKIKELNIGDKILTKEGYKNVQYIYPIKKQKTFKIKTKSGKEIICSGKHNFPVGDTLKSINNGLKVGDSLSVKK